MNGSTNKWDAGGGAKQARGENMKGFHATVTDSICALTIHDHDWGCTKLLVETVDHRAEAWNGKAIKILRMAEDDDMLPLLALSRS